MKKLSALIKKLYYDKKIRFLFVGGLNTLIGYGTYALFIFLGLHHIPAQTFSTVIGVINSYFWNKYFTFKQKKKSIPEIIRFVCVYLLSFGLSLLMNYLLIDLNGVNPYVSGLISLVITTLLSFFGHNFFSFKQKKRDTSSESDKTADNESDKTIKNESCGQENGNE